ncbi:MAG: hypothetical protein SLRJCFUN_001433 [Candidatus Fervidibacter sp.]
MQVAVVASDPKDDEAKGLVVVDSDEVVLGPTIHCAAFVLISFRGCSLRSYAVDCVPSRRDDSLQTPQPCHQRTGNGDLPRAPALTLKAGEFLITLRSLILPLNPQPRKSYPRVFGKSTIARQ